MTAGPGPYVLAPGESRVADAMLPFKASAADTAGVLSVCEFVLDGWASGPVLHAHDAVDEAFFVVEGRLEAALGADRHRVPAGSFLWVPRQTPHTFANGGPSRLHVLALALPGGIEAMFAEHAAHIAATEGSPDPAVMDEIGRRHGAPTLGPPIRAHDAPSAEG